MRFDPENGLLLFEVVLGFEMEGETRQTGVCLVQADDPDEAEEKVMESLAELGTEHTFWIEEMNELCDVEDYQQQVEEGRPETLPLLDEMAEDELRDFLML